MRFSTVLQSALSRFTVGAEADRSAPLFCAPTESSAKSLGTSLPVSRIVASCFPLGTSCAVDTAEPADEPAPAGDAAPPPVHAASANAKTTPLTPTIEI